MSVTATGPRLTYREMRSKAEVIADEIVKERVLAGIELLNKEYGPDWVEHIDPSSLDLASCSRCVLGQVYALEELPTQFRGDEGAFFGAARKLGIQGREYEYGFNTPDEEGESYYDYNVLGEAWMQVLT